MGGAGCWYWIDVEDVVLKPFAGPSKDEDARRDGDWLVNDDDEFVIEGNCEMLPGAYEAARFGEEPRDNGAALICEDGSEEPRILWDGLCIAVPPKL